MLAQGGKDLVYSLRAKEALIYTALESHKININSRQQLLISNISNMNLFEPVTFVWSISRKQSSCVQNVYA